VPFGEGAAEMLTQPDSSRVACTAITMSWLSTWNLFRLLTRRRGQTARRPRLSCSELNSVWTLSYNSELR